METIAFLGCSKGLGRAVALEMNQQVEPEKALLVSRNLEELNLLSAELSCPSTCLSLDLAKAPNITKLIDFLSEHKVSRILYFAGGGPFGDFSKKQWKDHQWALQVSLLTPAEILHSCLSDQRLSGVDQFIAVGSQIADSSADSKASSYAAAKHGLKGLLTSVIQEKTRLDIRLFRPGYMDTGMLPPNAAPRINGSKILSVDKAAKIFVDWCLDDKGSSELSC